MGPDAILFKPARRKNATQPLVKAVCVNHNGTESFASAADIASVVGRPFFQNESQEIGWERLRLWLDGLIDTYQATGWTLHQIYRTFADARREPVQPSLFAA